jgi:anaerobic ribonucleoside-triphosphate reductase activating protein
MPNQNPSAQELEPEPNPALQQTVRIFGTADDSIVDGPGIRYAIFTQGCARHCPGCHNPASQPFEGGIVITVAKIWEKIAATPLVSGITLSGGEPFDQPRPLIELARLAHEAGRNVWAYSGYTYEELLRDEPGNGAPELLRLCDVLVDGPFIESQRSLELHWKGSANQRVINVPASLEAGEVVPWQES